MSGEPPGSASDEHLNALWAKLEAALDLAISSRVMDRLEDIATLCEEAAQIAREDLARLR